jgi:ketosteroid isomerase-like protein
MGSRGLMKYTIFTLLCAVLLLSASCRGQEDAPEMPEARIETTEQPQEDDMKTCTFPDFPNVTVTGLDPDSLNEEEKAVLYAQARYCEAMTEADIDTLRTLTDEGKTYTHMSGLTQSREEYFADIADGSLTYYSIEMENPIVSVEGDRAEVTYTAALTASAYGARGTFRMKGTHIWEKRDGSWISVDP